MSDICINALLNYEIFIENKENVKSILGYWNVGCWQTTFANILKKKLNERKIVSILIDGDELREILKKENSYSKEERIEVAMIYSKLAKLISNQGITVIVSTISLIKEIHSWNKQNLKIILRYLLKETYQKS